MMIGVIAAVVAGVAALSGLLARELLHMAARLMFTPDMDDEWMVRAASSGAPGGPHSDKSMIARAPTPAADSNDRN